MSDGKHGGEVPKIMSKNADTCDIQKGQATL
jgi:hypothetical protein